GPRRRAARGAIQLPRVATGSAEQIIAQLLVAEVGCVSLAQQDGPAASHPLRDHAIGIRDMLLEELRAEGRADALGRLKILKRVRHAVKEAEQFAAEQARL